MGTDGPGGFLWKPISENPRLVAPGVFRRTLVVLLPGKFQSQFRQVILVRKTGREELADFTGFSNFDQDGLRQTWRGDFQGKEYDGSVVAVGGDPDQECRWKIDRPARRND